MALQTVAQIAMSKEDGDILVFMPGEPDAQLTRRNKLNWRYSCIAGYAEIEQLIQLLHTKYNAPLLKQAEAENAGGSAVQDKRVRLYLDPRRGPALTRSSLT